MNKYSIFEEKLNTGVNDYTTYGLKIFSENGQANIISDLSLDKNSVSIFCEKLNLLKISVTDLPELIEDFLSEL